MLSGGIGYMTVGYAMGREVLLFCEMTAGTIALKLGGRCQGPYVLASKGNLLGSSLCVGALFNQWTKTREAGASVL